MRGFSKAIIVGNLTRDPEMRSTPSGASVCGFSVAVNRNWKDNTGATQERTSYFDCNAWGKVGETIAQYAKKGSSVLVSGRLEQRSWDDKETGKKRSAVEIVVEDFNFMGGRNDDSGASAGASYAPRPSAAPAPKEETVPEDIPDDIDLSEIPF